MDRKYPVHPAKEILMNAGVTQKEIAEYFCLSSCYTRMLLNGKYRISPARNRQLWELVNKCRTEDLRQS